jgi:GLPGLI family protein
MGKSLVKDSLPSLKWKMEAEQEIGGYTCYKATAIKAASVILEISDLKRRS